MMLQQKSKKILIYFFLFLFIGTLNNKNLTDDNFSKVIKISIKGLDEKNNLQLTNDLNLLKSDNLFFLDKTKIINIITSNNLVENYEVFKRYPSSLDVAIDRTNFLAKIKKDGNNFILGSNGKIIKSYNEKKQLPFIFGDFKVKSFFDLKEVIDESNFEYSEIKNLFFFKSGRWDIETKNGLIIKLPKKDLKKSFKLLTEFLDENSKTKINKIDLRQYNQVVVNG